MECADILKDKDIQGETSDDNVCAQTLQKEHLEVQSAWTILILKKKLWIIKTGETEETKSEV